MNRFLILQSNEIESTLYQKLFYLIATIVFSRSFYRLNRSVEFLEETQKVNFGISVATEAFVNSVHVPIMFICCFIHFESFHNNPTKNV